MRTPLLLVASCAAAAPPSCPRPALAETAVVLPGFAGSADGVVLRAAFAPATAAVAAVGSPPRPSRPEPPRRTAVGFDPVGPAPRPGDDALALYALGAGTASENGLNAADGAADLTIALDDARLRAIRTRLRAARSGRRGVALYGGAFDTAGEAADDGPVLGRPLAAFVYGQFADGESRDEERPGDEPFAARNGVVAAGLDYAAGESVLLGVALSYAKGGAEVEGAPRPAKVDSYGLSLYGTFLDGLIYADATLGYSLNGLRDPDRPDGFAFLPTSDGGTRADTVSGALTLGLDLGRGAFAVGPFAGLRYARTRGDDDPGAEPFVAAGGDADGLSGSLGVAASYTVVTNGATLVPQLRLSLDDGLDVRERATSTGGSAAFDRGDADDPALRAGGGVALRLAPGLGGVLDYEARLGEGPEQVMTARLSWRF